MGNRILVFYGSYRSDRLGIRLAQFVVDGLRAGGDDVELIDAKAVGLPMLDRMYKEYPKGEAPARLEKLASQIRGADGFVFITGEYNWGVQPGLKNLTDHFLEEWFWRPAAIASYSAGRLAGVRAATAWHGRFRRWAWWWSHPRLGQGRLRKPSQWTPSQSARAAKRWSRRFRVSPTI
jgi:NAD(P)H-dependent FMN reductase